MAEGVEVDTQSHAEKQGAPPAPPAAGDAGSNYLSSMLSELDPLDEGSVKQFNVDAQSVKDLASAGPGGGGFAIEPEAGQKFIDAIDRYLNDVWPAIKGPTRRLIENPELGMSPYALQVAQHDV